MVEMHKILVARDESKSADHALNEALWLARQTGAALHVLHVDILLGESISFIDDADAEVLEIQERLRNVVAARGRGTATSPACDVPIIRRTVRAFAAAPAIVAYAADENVDLIVMGTHGRKGIRRMLAGSVAREVIRHAPCPVLTVHAADNKAKAPRGVKSILVPVDFSGHSRNALRFARAWAGLYDARIEILHVVEDYLAPSYYEASVPAVYDSTSDHEERTKAHLQQFARDVLGDIAGVHTSVVFGAAPDGITTFAKKHKSDLIILSTHGMTGLARLLLGSVAEKVTSLAPCPVLTLRAFETRMVPERSSEETSAS